MSHRILRLSLEINFPFTVPSPKVSHSQYPDHLYHLLEFREDKKSDYFLSCWHLAKRFIETPFLESEQVTQYRRPVIASEAQDLLDILRYTTLPMLAEEIGPQGRDGAEHTLTVLHSPMCQSMFRWNELPPGWEALASIQEQILDWAK